MDDVYKQLRRLCDRLSWARIEADAIICPGPCYIFGVELTASAVGAATAILYNGLNALGPKFVDLSCVLSTKDHREYGQPRFLDKGLFIAVGSNVTSVTVCILSINR